MRQRTVYLLGLALLIIGVVVSACTADSVEPQTTTTFVFPTEFPTAQNPLPTQPSPVPVGFAGSVEVVETAVPSLAPNPDGTGGSIGQPERTLRRYVRPIYIGFVLDNPTRAQTNALQDLQDALNAELGGAIYVALGYYTSEREALAAVCGRGTIPNGVNYAADIDTRTLDETSPVVLAWLDPFTYFNAIEAGCGTEAVYAVKREVNDTLVEGLSFEFIYKFRIPPNSAFEDIFTNVRNHSFCRLSGTDPISWIYPSIVIQAAALNPDKWGVTTPAIVRGIDRNVIKGWATVVDVENYNEMVRAIYFNDERNYQGKICDFGAIPVGQIADVVEEVQTEVREERDSESFTIGFGQEDSRYVRIMDPPESGWMTVPFPVFVTVPESVLPAESQQLMLTAIEAVLEETGNERLLKALVDYDMLEPLLDYEASDELEGVFNRVQLSPDYHEAFFQWLRDAQWNMGE